MFPVDLIGVQGIHVAIQVESRDPMLRYAATNAWQVEAAKGFQPQCVLRGPFMKTALLPV